MRGTKDKWWPKWPSWALRKLNRSDGINDCNRTEGVRIYWKEMRDRKEKTDVECDFGIKIKDEVEEGLVGRPGKGGELKSILHTETTESKFDDNGDL